MRELLVEGITEIELAGKLEAVARGAGHGLDAQEETLEVEPLATSTFSSAGAYP